MCLNTYVLPSQIIFYTFLYFRLIAHADDADINDPIATPEGKSLGGYQYYVISILTGTIN